MNTLIDTSKIIESFRQALEQAEIVTDEIIADDEIHRCGTTGKEKKKDGAYLFHNNPPYSGWYRNFRNDIEDTWTYEGNVSLAPDQLKAMRIKIEQEKEERFKERLKQQTAAAKRAEKQIAYLPAATPKNPYLTQKGVKPAGNLREEGDMLVVPMINEQGEIQSLQHIWPNGDKRFLKGGKTNGGYFPIKGDKGPLYIVEGIATGLTVYEATGETVLCAFNAGNLTNVARIARNLYPDRKIVIAADNDHQTKNNPGLTKGREAASEIGAKLSSPHFADNSLGSDFNDIHATGGIEEVRRQLNTIEIAMDEVPKNSGIPVNLKSLSPPEDFPFGIFPKDIEKALTAAAKAFGVPLAVPGLTFLVATAAAIGRTRALQVKPGWKVTPNIYAALVADSGMGKTPCTSRIFKALQQQDYKYYQEFQKKYAEYEDLLQAWKDSKKKSSSSSQEKPSIPTQTELLVDDATMEKIGHILAANPRGILWHRDELSGLINDLGKYSKNGKGDGDKARLLSAYSGEPWKASRVTKDGVYVPAACITLFGTIQPQILLNCFNKDDQYSGLLQRFIFIHAEKNTPSLWIDDVFDEEAAAPVDHALEFLMGLKLNQEENPYLIRLSEEGRAIAIDKFNKMACEVENNPELEQYKSLAPKQREQLFKICLNLHMLNCWEKGTPDSTPVSEDTVRKAVTLIDWIVKHQRSTWDMFNGKTKQISGKSLAKRIGKAIIKLEQKINKGVLLTGDIAADLNSDLPPEYHVSSRSVGKTYSQLGLSTGRGKSGERGVNISPETLKFLKQTFEKEKVKNSVPTSNPQKKQIGESPHQIWDGKNEVEI